MCERWCVKDGVRERVCDKVVCDKVVCEREGDKVLCERWGVKESV